MYPSIKQYCDSLIDEFKTIPDERKMLLARISEYLQSKIVNDQIAELVYICTHNSRRSQFGQIWAKLAAEYFGISGVNSSSAGTEVTEFNVQALNALRRIGFKIDPGDGEKNPVYSVFYDDRENAITCFSKVYHDLKYPGGKFAAIMTCSDAEQNCPFIPDAEFRISTTYDDPKAFDGTPLQEQKYDERCRQIARETWYVFSLINKRYDS